jgi:rubredoxin
MKPGWHICTLCNHIYEETLENKATTDPAKVEFLSLPDDWTCPDCGASKEMYQDCSCVAISEVAETVRVEPATP